MKPSYLIYSLLAISFTCLGLVVVKVDKTADEAKEDLILTMKQNIESQKKIDSLQHLLANSCCN